MIFVLKFAALRTLRFRTYKSRALVVLVNFITFRFEGDGLLGKALVILDFMATIFF